MTTIITRLYAAEEHAAAAVNALKAKFQDENINLVTPTSGHYDDIEKQVAKGGVPDSHTAHFAEKVRQGGSIVSVTAPWGFAKDAIKTLNKHGPIDAGVKNPDFHFAPGWNEAAPFSAGLGLTVLAKSKSSIILSDNPSPFSSIFKLPELTKSKSGTALLDKAVVFSSLLGLPTISHAKPFSSLSKSDKSGATLL